jgi:hypothetical protein
MAKDVSMAKKAVTMETREGGDFYQVANKYVYTSCSIDYVY